MATAEEHAHEHEYIDIAESDTVSVYAEGIHETITFQFNPKGIALMLSYEEALELAEVMPAVKKHCESRGEQPAQ